MKYIDAERLQAFKEVLADTIVSAQGLPTYEDCKERAEAETDVLLATLFPLQQEQPIEIHIDNPNIQKFDPNIKVETRTDGTGDIDGKAMLYVADKSYKIGFRDGKASKEQPMEGLEDEYVRFVRTDHHQYQDLIGNGGLDLARHFYELGCHRTAEMYDDIEYNKQMAEEKQLVEGLEDNKIIDYAHSKFYYDKDFDGYGHSKFRPVFTREDLISFARHFTECGRKQVLQEIYDGKVKPVDKITAAWLDDEQNT